MSNFRDILVQIIDVIGLPAWRDRDIDDFLGIAEVVAPVAARDVGGRCFGRACGLTT